MSADARSLLADALRDLERHLAQGLVGVRKEWGASAPDQTIAQYLTGYLAMQYPHTLAAPAPPELDVERLAGTLHWYAENAHIRRQVAKRIAAAYAAAGGAAGEGTL